MRASLCILTSALLVLPAVSAKVPSRREEDLPQHYWPSEWVAKMKSLVPNPYPSSPTQFYIPSRINIPSSQRAASALWKVFPHTNAARVLTTPYQRARRLLSAKTAEKATVVVNRGYDWVGFLGETIEVELADRTRGFRRPSLGRRGVYHWSVEGSNHLAPPSKKGAGGKKVNKKDSYWVDTAAAFAPRVVRLLTVVWMSGLALFGVSLVGCVSAAGIGRVSSPLLLQVFLAPFRAVTETPDRPEQPSCRVVDAPVE